MALSWPVCSAGEGSGHLHAFRGREGCLLPEVDVELVHHGTVGKSDAFHADIQVLQLFGFGGDMGHSFGPVVGPDLLGGEGEGGREGSQEKDRLFHH